MTESIALLRRMNFIITSTAEQITGRLVMYTTHEEYKELKCTFEEAYHHGQVFIFEHLSELGVPNFLLSGVPIIGCDFVDDKVQFPASLYGYTKIYLPIMRNALNSKAGA